MNNAKLEAEFHENPNPSRTALKRIANANGMDLSEVQQWFELKRLSSVAVEGIEVQNLVPDRNVPGSSEVQDLVRDVPEANEVGRGVRRAREESEHQDRDQLPVKRPAVTDAVIQKIHEKLDLYLQTPKSQDFFMGIRKILGPEVSEADTNQKIIGVDANVIRDWSKKPEDKELPVPPVQAPVFNRKQLPDRQAPTLPNGVKIEPIDERDDDIAEVEVVVNQEALERRRRLMQQKFLN